MSDSFTFNFNGPVGQNIAKVDKMIVNMDKDGKIQVMNAGNIEMQNNQESMEPITKEEIDALFDNPSNTEVEQATLTDEDSDPHTNIKLRRRLLKQCYDELLKTDFNQGSD